MDLNIPKSSTVSHELPIFNELSQDSGLPVSEVKARFRNKMLDLHQKALDDPSTQPLGTDSQEMAHTAVNELRTELDHPEENWDDNDEYDQIMGFDPTQPAPGSDIFGADDFGGGDFGGGDSFGGGDFGGGGFGGGIDNLDMGFSDEGMDAVNSVADDGFGDFGSEDDAGSVNAMSEIEPSGDSGETVEPSSEESGSDNLDLDI